MIRCLLIHLKRDAQGLPCRSEIQVSHEAIALGRDAACPIHLPDHRVAFSHARLQRRHDGSIEIEAAPDALLSINGHIEHTAELTPGTLLDIGPYRLTVLAPTAGNDLTLEIESVLTRESPTTPAHISTRLMLGSKRRAGYILALAILLGLFITPLLTRLSPAYESWQANLPLPLTRLLNPGALSAGHALFADKCSTCHKSAFRAVTDTNCTTCHAGMATHLVAGHAEQARIEHVRCRDCHPAHAGKVAARKELSPTCVGCHAGVGSTVLTQARDFGSAHPEFELAFPQEKDILRVRQDRLPLPPDHAGLKFPHNIHLDKKGVASPDGDTILECRNCHKPDPGGKHFEPIDMQASCQQSRCHSLRLAEPVRGIVPHGSERLPLQHARAHYLKSLATSPEEQARLCGPVPKDATSLGNAMACADRLALKFAELNVFQSSGDALQCAACHRIRKTTNPESPWQVAPVRINRDWHLKAVFPHSKHATSKCEDCHQKAKSTTAADVSMPDLASCRQCHKGLTGPSGKVRSRCKDCHPFHRQPVPPAE